MAKIRLTENSMGVLFNKIGKRAELRKRINKGHDFNMDELEVTAQPMTEQERDLAFVTLPVSGVYMDTSLVIVQFDFEYLKDNGYNVNWNNRLLVCTNPNLKSLEYAVRKMSEKDLPFRPIKFNLLGNLQE
jgi:hypothetical protein